MRFAQRIDRIQPSATLAMTAKAADLRAQGIDVLNMSVGEPDFNTPNHIIDAAITAMNNGHTRYTPGGGTTQLKQAIQQKLSRDNNITCAVSVHEFNIFGRDLNEMELQYHIY